jgi:DNA-binding transcriptional MerR regulator
MRIGELARRGGVPVGTVKYYLREGLLPPGELTSATQARYDEAHVARLNLVKALVGVGGLSIAAAGDVLRAIEDPPATVHELLGVTRPKHASDDPDADPAALARARALVDRWGWRIHPDTPMAPLAAALDAAAMVGIADLDATLDRYAALMAELAAGDLAEVPVDDPGETVRFVVTATVLLEPLLLALRRLAQQDASARRFGG